MALSRNQEHFIILTVIYNEITDFSFGKNEVHRSAITLMEELCEVENEKDIPLFVIKSVVESLNHYGEIVKVIEPHLTKIKWNRLPALTQALLIKSYAHYYFVEKDNIDKKVVINVALELAKKYIDDKQAKFVNAILDKVL